MGSIRELKRDDGSVTYHAEVRRRGIPPQRASFRTKSLAKQWVQKVESEIQEGTALQLIETAKHTVGDLVRRHCAELSTQHPERLAAQVGYFAWWESAYGALPLNELTPSLLCTARTALASEKVPGGRLRNPATVNRYLAALGGALSKAVKEWQWIETNPMHRISKLRESSGRDRFLSLEERALFLEECRKSPNVNLYPIVVVALVTGMRYGEIVGLTWQDVDFGYGMLKLRKTKNGDVRVVPMNHEVESMLRGLPTFGLGPTQLVFQSQRSATPTLSGVHIRGAFETACRNTGLKDFRFHDLRHTAASYMAMNGATQGELMAVLGHRCPAMTRRYAHYAQGHLKKLVEKNSLGIQLNKPQPPQSSD